MAWRREGEWNRRVVNREAIASARTIVDLAAFGLPVTSNNAKSFVQYLSDFETANIDVLPRIRVAKQLGFHEFGDERGFLWGNQLITADGSVTVEQFGDSLSKDDIKNRVIFRGADEGDDQIAEGFRQRGTYEGWLKSIGCLRPHSKARLAIYASLSSVMLEVFGSPNFGVDYAGETTRGKTTALRVAASCFGNPDERDNKLPAAISTWGGTPVWRERAPVVLNNLPFILDDTKHASSPNDVANTVYMVTQGRGRGRGTVKGTAKTDSFSTVLISSGEQPITSFTEDGGTRVLAACRLINKPVRLLLNAREAV